MNSFKIKEYRIHTGRLSGSRPVRLLLLADLHGLVFGNNHQELYEAVTGCAPDAVVIAGDMVVSDRPETLSPAAGFLTRISGDIPVYYAAGNHETRMTENPDYASAYRNYERLLTMAGICFLHNDQVMSSFKGSDLIFHGLELPLEYYSRTGTPALSDSTLESLIGKPRQNGFHILIAHSPKFGDSYFNWGADLILSGHYHGGMLRLGEHVGVVSPYLRLFPAYCCGRFTRGEQNLIVSAGMGEHTIPLRIHNPRELIKIDLLPIESQF